MEHEEVLKFRVYLHDTSDTSIHKKLKVHLSFGIFGLSYFDSSRKITGIYEYEIRSATFNSTTGTLVIILQDKTTLVFHGFQVHDYDILGSVFEKFDKPLV